MNESTVETIVKPLIVIMVIEKHDKLTCNNFLKNVNISHNYTLFKLY